MNIRINICLPTSHLYSIPENINKQHKKGPQFKVHVSAGRVVKPVIYIKSVLEPYVKHDFSSSIQSAVLFLLQFVRFL